MSTRFEKKYWDANYSQPKTMDCIGNAKQHVDYLKSFLALEFVDVSSVIDLGFGMGFLFQKVLKAFLPYKAWGLEPSEYMFSKADVNKMRPVESTKLMLTQESLEQWCRRAESKKLSFDLGLCTSVFQYIESEELDYCVAIMSKRIKYLYLTVPTDKELKRQREDLNFHDEYAISRSRNFYHKLMKPYFTNVGNKVWESKYHFDESNTHFSDLVYRY